MAEMPWFRFYSSALNDPKVQKLPGETFKFWINVLCLASEQEERGTLPDSGDIAFRLRLDEAACDALLAQLVAARLLDVPDLDGEPLAIHAWQKRQPPSDADATATERKRRQRERERAARAARAPRQQPDADEAVTRDDHDGHGSVTRDLTVTFCDGHDRSRNVTRLEQSREERETEGEGEESSASRVTASSSERSRVTPPSAYGLDHGLAAREWLKQGYAIFRRAYPGNKSFGPAAKDAWDAACTGPDRFEQIMDGLARWAGCAQWREEGGKFAKSPIVFLQDELFADEPPRSAFRAAGGKGLTDAEKVAEATRMALAARAARASPVPDAGATYPVGSTGANVIEGHFRQRSVR